MDQPYRLAAIVTGAGSGIGQATGVLLAAGGYRLALVGRQIDKLKKTEAHCLDAAPPGVEVDTELIAADLCDPDTWGRIIEQAVQRFDRLDAIANVAGVAQMGPIESVTHEDWRRCIDTNLSCVVNLTAAAWPIFARQGSGVIVNVSSMASIDPFPGLGIYATAKAGLNMFTSCTAQEGKGIGLKAVAIAPGAVETPMLRSLFDTDAIPPDRALDPRAVAQVICGCITGKRAFESGSVIQLPSPG